jgi:hypothetical protein
MALLMLEANIKNQARLLRIVGKVSKMASSGNCGTLNSEIIVISERILTLSWAMAGTKTKSGS